jgi:hypothetical protein
MQYQVERSHEIQDEWCVEAINHEGDGEIYVAIFSGPDAKRRAEEYAAWKDAKTRIRAVTSFPIGDVAT